LLFVFLNVEKIFLILSFSILKTKMIYIIINEFFSKSLIMSELKEINCEIKYNDSAKIT
jgi:hypothetical protein